jgi:hypothetical protein
MLIVIIGINLKIRLIDILVTFNYDSIFFII